MRLEFKKLVDAHERKKCSFLSEKVTPFRGKETCFHSKTSEELLVASCLSDTEHRTIFWLKGHSLEHS